MKKRMKPYKRSIYMINAKFQLKMIGVFLLSVSLTMIVITMVMSGVFWARSMVGENVFKEFITIDKIVTEKKEVMVDGQKTIQLESVPKTFVGIKRWEIVLPPLILNNGIVLVVLMLVGILYTHRIAGPVYAMVRDIEAVLNGSTDVQVHLRKHDSFQELGDSVNKLIDQYYKLAQKK